MNIKNIFVQKESLREQAVPFVSQMFELVLEAVIAGSALAFGLLLRLGRQAAPGRSGSQQGAGHRAHSPGKNCIRR